MTDFVQDHTAYPHITKLTLDMVGYNGGLHALRAPEIGAEADVLRLLDECIGAEGVYHDNLKVLDDWLGTLTEEQFFNIADGEEGAIREQLKDAPRISDDPADTTADFIDQIYEHCI